MGFALLCCTEGKCFSLPIWTWSKPPKIQWNFLLSKILVSDPPTSVLNMLQYLGLGRGRDDCGEEKWFARWWHTDCRIIRLFYFCRDSFSKQLMNCKDQNKIIKILHWRRREAKIICVIRKEGWTSLTFCPWEGSSSLPPPPITHWRSFPQFWHSIHYPFLCRSVREQ